MRCLCSILKNLFTSFWIYGVNFCGNCEYIVEVITHSNSMRPPKTGQVLREPVRRFQRNA